MRTTLLLTALAVLLGGAAPKPNKRKPGNINVLVYNYATSASFNYEVKVYDGTSGTVYYDDVFTLANANPVTGAPTSFSSGTISLSDANPQISIKWSDSPAHECSFYMSYPNGGGCHTSATGSNTLSWSITSGGYGTYEYDYYLGEGCP